MKGIAIVGTKGGVGKTSIAHLLALGAAWKNTPAYLMHTDDREGSVAKNKITLLPTIIRFNFSQRNFTCSTKNGAIF
ncbi:hypothetical protein [Bathymodiolus platifrons methanotrophic gill symbiont]|uniref:hypothetical protein n=1 Tax=Bathymodiolus platifrons methanotrophic gill symbiont TaxID=113268 RepID=UPI001C8E79FF|nr:hypothetical protein [Bathymodiolus platifrons methanotrophic gill symbiont]